MSMGEVKKIVVCLTDSEAMALAQFLKRVGFGEVRVNAVDDADAYKMMDSLSYVRDALKDAGFNPR